MIISTNEVLYRLIKILKISLDEMLEIYALESYSIEKSHLEKLLKRRQDKEFQLCSYEELGVFLDGLIVSKRGPSPQKKSEELQELTHNLILKKLRIALNLKESEVEIIFQLAEVSLTKQELKSLFRKESHKNFKVCSDELMIAFLEGLDEFYYVGEVEEL